MSIAGIDWDLADKIYAREEGKIASDTTKRKQEIARDCRSRGIAGTTPCLSQMHRATMDMLSRLAEASIDADWEIVAVSQIRGEISEVIIDEIINRLKHRLSKHIRNFMQSAEASIQSNNIDPVILVSFRAKNEKSMGNLLGKEKRELDIRRGLMTIEEMKKKRFQFLHKLYNMVEGDESQIEHGATVGNELGFDKILSHKIVQYLDGEGLIEINDSFKQDHMIRIAHQGVIEVESALSDPDKPTQYFPPVNVIYVGRDMVSSQIQQASPGATQVITIGGDRLEELEGIIQSLKDSIDNLQLEGQEESDLQAEIQTIEAQMGSSKPKRVVIKESLKSIRDILAGAIGSLLASELLSEKIVPFLDKLF